MGNIPTFFRGREASERVNIRSVSDPREAIAQGISNVAGVLGKAYIQKSNEAKALVDRTNLIKMTGHYASDIMKMTDEVRAEYLTEPSKANEVIKGERDRILQKYTNIAEEGGFGGSFSKEGESINKLSNMEDTKWAINQSREVARVNLIDNINDTAKRIGTQDGSMEGLLANMFLLDLNQKEYNTSFGLTEGTKVVTAGKKKYAEAFVDNLIERGDKIQLFNLLKNPETSKPLQSIPGMKEYITESIKGMEEQEKLFDLASHEATMQDLVENGADASISELREIRSDNAYALEYGVLTDQQKVQKLAERRNIDIMLKYKMTQVQDNVEDDVQAVGDIEIRIADMVLTTGTKREGSRLYPTVGKKYSETLEGIAKVQMDLADLLDEGKISMDTYKDFYKKLGILSGGVKTVSMQENKGFFGVGDGGFNIDPQKVSDQKSVGKALNEMLRNIENKQQAGYAVDYFLSNVLENNIEGTNLKGYLNTNKNTIIKESLGKAWLKNNGFLDDLKVGDMLDFSSGSYKIVGFSPEGVPLLEVK